MDMNFRWMTQPYEDAAREAENRERKEAIARQLGMRNAAQGAFNAGQQALQEASIANMLLPQGRQQYQMGIQNQMAQEAQQAIQQQQQAIQQQQQLAAKRARLAELQGKFSKITNDPRMRMSAMLMMAGQPGALQSFLMDGNKNGVSEAQSSLDELEKSMANDMFGLVGLSKSDYKKLTGALIPIYKSKWEELVNKGARSRLGNDWASAWGIHFNRGAKDRKDAEDKAEADKKKAKASATALFGG